MAPRAIEHKLFLFERVEQDPVGLDVTITLVRVSTPKRVLTMLWGQLPPFGQRLNHPEQLLHILPPPQKALHVALELGCSPNYPLQESRSCRKSSTVRKAGMAARSSANACSVVSLGNSRTIVVDRNDQGIRLSF